MQESLWVVTLVWRDCATYFISLIFALTESRVNQFMILQGYLFTGHWIPELEEKRQEVNRQKRNKNNLYIIAN